MSRILAIACLAASLVACATDGEDDPNPNQMAQQSVVPQEGQWYYADVTEISSTCGATDNGVAGGFAILGASAAGFTVNDGDGQFGCSLSGSSFHCPNRAQALEDLRPDVDALVTAQATATGTFASATSGSGSQEATVNCVGSACAFAGTWPCTFKVSFQIRAE